MYPEGDRLRLATGTARASLVKVEVLFSGGLHVHYGQVYVESGWETPDGLLNAAFAGQVNGLCGAATPGYLFMVTGLHTGRVGFTVELHAGAPPIDDSWEEVVEVSFEPTGDDVRLVQWAGEAAWPLALQRTSHRARYSAWGMDQGRQADTVLHGQPEVDRYLLQFWPAPPAPDQVVKQTSPIAAYWHRYAQELPPPPSEHEKARMAKEAARQDEARRWQFEVDLMWGGIPPSERLLGVGGNKYELARIDRALLDALAAAPATTQRNIARWAARRACDEAGLSELEWVRPALDAVDGDEPLPPPFDDPSHAWERLFGGALRAQAVIASPEDPPQRMWPPAAALPTVFAAAEPDALHAAIDAVVGATVVFFDQSPRLLGDLRAAFPALEC